MKHLISVVASLYIFFLSANGQFLQDPYLPKTVIVKFKVSTEKMATTSPYPSAYKYLTVLGISSERKLFPRSKPVPGVPQSVDLSTITEFTYSRNYPVEKVVAYLNTLDEVEYAQPHYLSSPLFSTNDTLRGNEYYLDIINTQGAWDICQGDSTVVIGISDTGFDLSHDDLVNKIAYNSGDSINGADDDGDGYVDNFRGWNFVTNSNNPQYTSSTHGTEVAGIIAAQCNNKIGVAGVGFKCSFLPVKITNDNNQNVFDHESIVYMADHGASIINCSWGGFSYQQLGQDVVNYATFNRNATVVCAAGNSNSTRLVYPASYDNAISVAATTSKDQKWNPGNTGSTGGSSYGTRIYASAPGVFIQTTTTNNSYVVGKWGTSYSAPVFSGAAGIVKSFFKQFNSLQVAEQLRVTADNIDTIAYNNTYQKLLGSGRINLYKALSDTSRPSIRFVAYSIVEFNNNHLLPGDTVIIRGSFTNYLHSSSSMTVRISNSDGYIRPLKESCSLTPINTMDSIHDMEFAFVISKNIPTDATINLLLSYSGGTYGDFQYISLMANPSCKTISANQISTSVTNSGSIGYNVTNTTQGIGMTYKGKQLFYGGTLVLAKDTAQMIYNLLSSNNFISQLAPSYEYDGNKAVVSSSYYGRYASSVNFYFKIDQKVTAWENDSSFVLYEYDIINNSLDKVEGLRSGVLLDWGVGNPLLNLASLYGNDGAVVVSSIEKGSSIAGSVVLSPKPSTNYFIESGDSSDLNLIVDDGMSNRELFYAMCHSKTSMNAPLYSGSDVVVMSSTQPDTLAPGDTLHLALVLFATSTEENVSPIIKRAKELYGIEHPGFVQTTVVVQDQISIKPNPTSSSRITISIQTRNDDRIDVQLLDNLGKVLDSNKYLLNQGENSVEVSGLDNPGVYFVRISTTKSTKTYKVLRK